MDDQEEGELMKFSAGMDRLICSPRQIDANDDMSAAFADVDGDRIARTGEVVSVGPGITYYRKGDLVAWGRYSGTEIGEHIVLRQDEILARIEKAIANE